MPAPKPDPDDLCGIYVRASKDATGEGKSVEDQRTECEALAQRLGYSNIVIYEDNAKTASDPRRRRPEYDRLLEDIKSGKVRCLIAWHPDRLHRRNAELEPFMQVYDSWPGEGDLPIYTAQTGDDRSGYNVATPEGRLFARVVGAVAQYEVEHKADRQAKDYRAKVAAGELPHQGRTRLFGYELGTKPKIRKGEAKLIREANSRILKGETARAISLDWRARGIVTTTGALWPRNSSRLREVLTNPRIAGHAYYDGERYEGTWTPIVDEGEFREVCAILNAPSRRTQASTARKALLPGFVYCGKCNHNMYSGHSKGKRTYRCNKDNGGCGSCSILAEPVDEAVREWVVALAGYQDDEVQPSSEVAAAVAQITRLQAVLEEANAMYAAGDIDKQEFQAIRATNRALIQSQQATAAEATLGAALADVPMHDADEMRKAWDERGLDFRRSLIEAMVAKVTILPAGRKGSQYKNADGVVVSVDPKSRVDITTRDRDFGRNGIAPRRKASSPAFVAKRKRPSAP